MRDSVAGMGKYLELQPGIPDMPRVNPTVRAGRSRARERLAGGLLLGLAALLLPSVHLFAQAGARVDSNPQLFAVMCALHAAGYESTVSLAGSLPIRARLRAELQAQQGPATQALRAFYRKHALSDAGATLSRYI